MCSIVHACMDVKKLFLSRLWMKAGQLLRAISTLLELSTDEEKYIREYLEYKVHVYRYHPGLLYTIMIKTIKSLQCWFFDIIIMQVALKHNSFPFPMAYIIMSLYLCILLPHRCHGLVQCHLLQRYPSRASMTIIIIITIKLKLS